MKYIFQIVLSVAGGLLGAYLFTQTTPMFGATTARTTITNPWTFSTSTILSRTVTITTTNTATSTLIAGCIQGYATSTATPWKQVIAAISTTTTTYGNGTSGAPALWVYGSCPNL